MRPDDEASPIPRPVAPEFPFAEARAAATVLDDLIAAMGAAAHQVDAAAGGLLAGTTFSGTARARFATGLEDASSELRGLWQGATGSLPADLAWLRAEIEQAETRRSTYQEDLATWEAARA